MKLAILIFLGFMSSAQSFAGPIPIQQEVCWNWNKTSSVKLFKITYSDSDAVSFFVNTDYATSDKAFDNLPEAKEYFDSYCRSLKASE